jgi:hypothetical protein
MLLTLQHHPKPPESSNSYQIFNPETFGEDWIGWDNRIDTRLSPTWDFFPETKSKLVTPNMRNMDMQGGDNCINPANLEDSSAVFGEDPLTDQPLFQTPTSLISPPIDFPEECLYSTPLSWSRPSPGGRRMNSYNRNETIIQSQENRLRDMAMPSTYPRSPSASSSDEPHANQRKRKSFADDDDDEEYGSPEHSSNGRHPPVKKTAHNMIEKRYRTNLNDKIAALRDSVPSLRAMTKKNSRGEDIIREDLQGLTPAHKLNKVSFFVPSTTQIIYVWFEAEN